MKRKKIILVALLAFIFCTNSHVFATNQECTVQEKCPVPARSITFVNDSDTDVVVRVSWWVNWIPLPLIYTSCKDIPLRSGDSYSVKTSAIWVAKYAQIINDPKHSHYYATKVQTNETWPVTRLKVHQIN